MTPHVRLLVGWFGGRLVGLRKSVITVKNAVKLHFHDAFKHLVCNLPPVFNNKLDGWTFFMFMM